MLLTLFLQLFIMGRQCNSAETVLIGHISLAIRYVMAFAISLCLWELDVDMRWHCKVCPYLRTVWWWQESLDIFSKHALAIRTGVADGKNFQAGEEQSSQVEMEGFTALTTQDTACGRIIVLLRLSCFHE